MLRGTLSLARNTAGYRTTWRAMSAVSFEAFGAPEQVLKTSKGASAAAAPSGNQVAVQIKSAMINQEDILAISGASASRSSPGVAGLFGVGVVTATGPAATGFSRQDTVLVTSPDAGTWQNDVVVSSQHVVKLPIPADKATFLPAAVTAALALRSYPLQQGDVVLQNNGSSAVAKALVQLARVKGAKVVTVSDQQGAAGDLVVTSSELNSPNFASQLKALGGAVKLVVDGLGDKAASNLSRHLSPHGVFTSVGTTSAVGALKFPVRALIFDDITVKGVNFHRTARQQPEVFVQVVGEVSELVKQGKVAVDGRSFALDDVLGAVNAVATGAGDVYLKL